jgi:hypothetical protein
MSRRDHGSGSVYKRSSDGRWMGTYEDGWTAAGTRPRRTPRGSWRDVARGCAPLEQRGLGASRRLGWSPLSPRRRELVPIARLQPAPIGADCPGGGYSPSGEPSRLRASARYALSRASSLPDATSPEILCSSRARESERATLAQGGAIRSNRSAGAGSSRLSRIVVNSSMSSAHALLAGARPAGCLGTLGRGARGLRVAAGLGAVLVGVKHARGRHPEGGAGVRFHVEKTTGCTYTRQGV